MSNRGRSQSARNYIGTNASQPPNITFVDHRPTQFDRDNYEIGDLWLFTDPAQANYEELYYLASLAANGYNQGKFAKWVLLASGNGPLEHLTTDDAVIVLPQAANINIKGDGTSIITSGDNVTGSVIISAIGGGEFIETINTNTAPVMPINNVIGVLGGQNITTAGVANNVIVNLMNNVVLPPAGSLTMQGLGRGVVQTTSGGAFFSSDGLAGQVLIGGNDGFGGGPPPAWAYITEGLGIHITSGPNTMEIALDGATATAFRSDLGIGFDAVPIAGLLKILGTANEISTLSPGAGNVITLSLPADIILPGSLKIPLLSGPGTVRTDNTGLFTVLSDSAVDGQFLISSSIGTPIWASLTAGANITLTPGHNSLQISSAGGGGGGGITTVHTNAGNALINAGDSSVTIVGTGNMNITGDGVHTATVAISNSPTFSGTVTGNVVNSTTTMTAGTGLTVTTGALTVGSFGKGVLHSTAGGVISPIAGEADNKIIIGSTAGAPTWGNLTSTGATIAISYPAGNINIEATGTAGLVQLTSDLGVVTSLAGNINAYAGANTNTDNTGGAHILRVNLNKSINQPTTTADGLQGLYSINSTDFMHSFSSDGTNTFLGKLAGNRTLSTSVSNLGLGTTSLQSLTTGSNNVAISGGSAVTTGSSNVMIAGGGNYVTTSNNIAIANAGNILDSGAIRIGTAGTHLNTYIAGVYQKTYSATSEVAFADSTGKIGTSKGTDGMVIIGSTAGNPIWANITGSGGITVTSGSNTINLSGSGVAATLTIHTNNGDANSALGAVTFQDGENINMSGSGSTVIVNLNRSIHWPVTAVVPGDPGGYDGVIFIGGGNSFMHARGTRNTFLGTLAGNFTLTTGSATDNTMIGANSGFALTTGQFNSSLGSGSLQALTSGSNNLAGGRNALLVATTATNNVALGSGSMDSATSSSGCTAVGRLSLASTVSSINSTAIGFGAGQSAVAAHDLTLVGYNSGNAITGAGANFTTSVGSSSFSKLTTGARCTGLGYQVGNNDNLTQADNTYIGYNAASGNNQQGNRNTVIGSTAFVQPSVGTGGSDMVVVGYDAYNNGYGTQSTIIGSIATGADNDVVIGYSANHTGTNVGGQGDNVVIGHNANLINGSQNSVIIGSGACSGNFTDSDNSVIIGYNANATSGGHSNCIYIGAGITATNLEDSVIRIGQPPMTAAYMAGIYLESIGNTNHVVSVDSLGKLGLPTVQSLSIPMFLYQQSGGNVPNVTGDNSVYTLGTGSLLVKIFDAQNNVTHPGNVMTFTAPIAGVYMFQMTVQATNLPLPPPPPAPAPNPSCPMDIVTTNRTYYMQPLFLGSNTGTTQSYAFLTMADMHLNDTVIWQWSLLCSPSAKTVGIGTNTFIGGYLIKAT